VPVGFGRIASSSNPFEVTKLESIDQVYEVVKSVVFSEVIGVSSLINIPFNFHTGVIEPDQPVPPFIFRVIVLPVDLFIGAIEIIGSWFVFVLKAPLEVISRLGADEP
jgi:hypothetical protein